jgi:hypothetical protein
LQSHDRIPVHPAKANRSAGRSIPAAGRRYGHVFVEGQSSGFPCAIMVYDTERATISAQGWLGVPDRFDLLVKPDGIRRACRVTARRGNTLVVIFDL